MNFDELEILEELDLSFFMTPGKFYPSENSNVIQYNFFLDLEHGYCETAGSRIHLYADSTRWAVVFEKSGYQNRGFSAEIELYYIGNCIEYTIEKFPERTYISNTKRIMLIEPKEYQRIEDKEEESFELIDSNTIEVNLRHKSIPFDNNHENYEKVGIQLRKFDNSRNLIAFGDLIRYLHETNPEIISATENEIREHIPKDIQKIQTINDFHFSSYYERENPPSKQETFKQIARILITQDTTNWKPNEKPNNSWKNWESGHL